MKTHSFLFLPLLLCGMVAAQSPVTTAVPFLSITPDARGAGLADCGVASEADAYSMYYNPAKYAFIGSNTTADLGVYYRKPVRLGGLDARLALGASITNLGTKIGYSKDKNPYLKEFIPTTLRLGTSLKVNLGGDHALTGMADLTKLLVPSQPTPATHLQSTFLCMIQSFYDAPGGFKEELYEINYGLGLDYAWRDMLHVRTGYFNQPALKGNLKYLSLGLGLELKHFGLDVCYDLSTTSTHNADYLKVDTHFKL